MVLLMIKAYIELSRKYHPDVNENSTPEVKALAKERFLQISSAYNTLSDPIARRDYDNFGVTRE